MADILPDDVPDCNVDAIELIRAEVERVKQTDDPDLIWGWLEVKPSKATWIEDQYSEYTLQDYIEALENL